MTTYFYNAVDAFTAAYEWDFETATEYKSTVTQRCMQAFAELMEHTTIARSTMYWAVVEAAWDRKEASWRSESAK